MASEFSLPGETHDKPIRGLSDRETGHIEGYAAGLQDLMYRLTGDNSSGKSYDPMLVDREAGKMYSYAFDMKDGGRHHPISEYETVNEILETLLAEAEGWIREDYTLDAKP